MMTLFSRADDPRSHAAHRAGGEGHRDRIVEVDPARPPEDLLDLNPYHTVPTLVDRDLVLYDSGIICEYLDERFPHPPLMPVDPGGARAGPPGAAPHRAGLVLARRRRSSPASAASSDASARVLRRASSPSEPLFRMRPWFLSDEFSLLDAAVAPILWRLPRWEVESARIGARQSSAMRSVSSPARRSAPSLSRAEREMRRVKSRRPYLLRAMHEWIIDSDCTPHLVVDAAHAGRRSAAAVREGRQDRAERQLDRDGAA